MFFSPLKFIAFPFVFLFALPLALCAGVTTVLAFFILFFQLFLVYFDVSLETLRYIFIGHATQSRYIAPRNILTISSDSSSNSTPLPSPSAATNRHRRRVKPYGNAGSAPMTPTFGVGFSTVAPSIGLERDFEGVGGWRLAGGDVDTDTTDDQQWLTHNSRLANPYRRHHFRSQSGGAILSGPAAPGRIKNQIY
ncbi:hypothetical protein GGS21DRAFT_515896 [Xylaria nigripes]|nr:hypothetical protein GGS21DRAFT_515896 [Xylaria nigripes]